MQAILQLTKQLSAAFTINSSSDAKKTLDNSTTTTKTSWWKETTVYQVWPASFKDGNGDGLGDIPGLISKLSYIADLGADVVWLSPMYASPQVDFGYDISDYEAVYPPYGTLDDMDQLIKGLHDRGMKLILDLVVNHTSDQHKWFIESASSKTNDKADWYIWKDAKTDKDGKRQPPNNWGCIFGGSAWEWCEAREQYYLHLFAKEQPDLNWECEATREAIYQSALRFWFEKGVDGFRVDTANMYSKVQSYPDAPVEGRFAPSYGDASKYYSNGPRIHEFYKEMRKQVIDKYGDPMMVGELPGTDIEETLRYVSTDSNELSMVFDFGVPGIGGVFERPKHEVDRATLPGLKRALVLPQHLASNTKAWATVFGENHDIPRSVSRLANLPSLPTPLNPTQHQRLGHILSLLLASLSGTLFLYQGQEIGMTNHPTTWTPSDLRDVDSLNYLADIAARYPGDAEMKERAWSAICAIGRDNARTPVQWTAEAATSAGFTREGVTPWMRVNENFSSINVESQVGDSDSVLGMWKRMIKLRKAEPALFVHGRYEVVDPENEDTVVFVKHEVVEGRETGRIAVVALNFKEDRKRFEMPGVVKGKQMEVVVGNGSGSENGDGEDMGMELGSWEGRVYVEKKK